MTAGSLLVSAIIMTGTPANGAISRISRTHPAPPHRAHPDAHAQTRADAGSGARTHAWTRAEHEAHERHEAHEAYEASGAHRAGPPGTTARHKTKPASAKATPTSTSKSKSTARPKASSKATATRKAAKTAKTKASARRWQLDIPGIGVLSKLMVLADHHDNDLPVPSLADAGSAAWYGFTATPGSPGNAVMVGHVDTYTGAGVFYDLYLLRPGNPVYVQMSGKRLRFAVTSVREVPKQQFPVDQVFGPTTARRLWLVTCGGDFDYTTRHYLDNIVVSAVYQPTRHD
jgi:sortase (surface protein transpeptidase)